MTMKTKKSLIICILLLLLIPFQVQASFFKELSIKNGLSSRRVYAAAKDNKGYVWFATRAGIDRYNGEHFANYTFPQNDEQAYERSKGVLQDRHGHIYAFSDKNIYAYNEEKDKFEVCRSLKIKETEGIISIFFSENNTLWVGTTEGLHKIPEGSMSASFPLSKKCAVYSITGDNHNLWIGTSVGIIKLLCNANSYRPIPEPPLETFEKVRIQSLYFDNKTKFLWIGTFSNGLKIYDTENQEMKVPDTPALNLPIRKITDVNDTEIWLGIDGGGIYTFNRFDGKLRHKYLSSSPGQERIKTNSIYDILNDGELVWICTYSSGIAAYNKDRIIQHVFQHVDNDENTLGNNHVNTIMEDSKGNYWFGTNNGLSMYNIHGNQWTHYLQNKITGHSVILSVYEDSKGRIWAGGYANDLVCIHPQKQQVETINLPHRSRNKNYIYSILQDREGTIWLGGVIDALTNYNPETGETQQYPLRGINKIIEYNDTLLAIATNRGFYFFRKKTGEFYPINFQEVKGEKATYAFPFVNNLYINPQQPTTIYIGTENDGLYHYNVTNQELKRYSTQNGLSSDKICSILSDPLGRLWISTENGLNCFNTQTSRIDAFYEMDGLPENTFNFLAYCLCRNGNMLWGTPEGAVEIIPGMLKEKDEKLFNLRFERFSLFYSKITTDDNNSPLSTGIDSTTVLRLKHNQHSFTFDFINLDYSTNSPILYTWKLNGFDERWSYPSNEHRAIYTNIPPGNYTFIVKAFQAGNEQVSSTREIQVIISSPFWATGWAYTVYFLIFIILLYFAIKAYKDRLDAKDSDQKIRFFVNIAHDIRTPLTLIKAPLNEIETEPLSDNGRSALQLARKNTEKLLNMVSQLLDFQKIEREAMGLHIEETQINPFIESCVTSFQLLAKEKQINLELHLPEEKTSGWLDRKKITLILDNLLSNSIKYTNTYGNINIRVAIKSHLLSIDITDDGIGISANAQKKLFNRFYRAENAANSNETGSGIGLLLTKKMTILHKGTITFSSTEGVGTTFHIEIPIDKETYTPTEIIRKERMEVIDEPIEEENTNTIKLLLVEDNEELRTYLVKCLKKNYSIEEAADGMEAQEMIRKNTPDFIISDIMMPTISGIELCTQLKSNIETCHIPIILLTSLAEREDIIKGFNAGADDYITKPFDLSVLESKINAILKNRTLYRKKYIDKSAFTDESAIANELDKKFMNRVVDYIEEKMINEDFSIDALAVEMAMSRSVFYKKIKSLTTQNPQEFIRDIRMKKAGALLREKKYSIGEIAYLTGYPNAKYFSTAFKKYYGTTPTLFIEKE